MLVLVFVLEEGVVVVVVVILMLLQLDSTTLQLKTSQSKDLTSQWKSPKTERTNLTERTNSTELRMKKQNEAT